jgi:hypothetical protein
MTTESTSGHNDLAVIELTPEQWAKIVIMIAHDNKRKEGG